MAEFMKTLLSLSFSGTILFLFVLVITRLFKSRLSRGWQYYIWLFVILRFLIPLAPGGNVANALFQRADVFWQNEDVITAMSSENTASMVEDDAEDAVIDRDEAVIDRDEALGTDAGITTASSENEPRPIRHQDTFRPEAKKSRMQDFTGWLFFLWAGGALFMLVRRIAAYGRYVRYLKSGNTEVMEVSLLNLLEEGQKRLHIKRNIKLYRNQTLFSPIMTGFFNPCIILPEKALTAEEARYIFAHELVHYQYRDMFYKWLVQITICLHWFNPAVYFLAKRVNENCELSCDEKVIKALDKQERKAYGDALLSFMKTKKHYENPTASLTLSEGAEQLIERLGAIMDYKKRTKTGILFAGVLTVAVCFIFTVLGAYAEEKTENARSLAVGGYADRGEEESQPKKQLQEAEESAAGNYCIVSKDNIYYVLVGGAGPDDIPVGSETKGFIGIVLVREDGYTSMGPFSKNNFLDKVEKECGNCLEKEYLSNEEKNIILEAAEEIADSGFGVFEEDILWKMEMEEEENEEDVQSDNMKASYCQRSFYCEPYVIELGWNLSEKMLQHSGIETGMESRPNQSVTLTDGSNMTVYFREELRKDMADTDVLTAVAGAIDLAKRKTEEEGNAYGMYLPEVEVPYILTILYVPRDEINDFAENAWQNDDVGRFCYITDGLTDEVKVDYCERAYNEDRIDFFAVIYDELPQEEIDNFGRRCYEDDNENYFAILCDDLSAKAKRELRNKAKQEGKNDYYYIMNH